MATANNKTHFFRTHERVTWKNELLDLATGEITEPPSMTKQSFVAECDINNILKQYKRSGMIQHINAQAAQGRYLDLPPEPDFQSALNLVIQAEDSFASLPSKLRTRFGNDPAEFLVFMADPANQDEAIALGLAQDNRPKAPPPLSPTPPPGPEISPPGPKPGVQG